MNNQTEEEGSENVRRGDREQVTVIIATTGSESLAVDHDSGYATATIRAVFALLYYRRYAFAVLGLARPSSPRGSD
jgi:hypothetical protein